MHGDVRVAGKTLTQTHQPPTDTMPTLANETTPPPDLAQAMTALAELESVLTRESHALDVLDFAAIDETTRTKEDIARRLRFAPGSRIDARAHASELRALERRIVAMAHTNEVRLRATLASVRGLLQTLVGDPPATYGKLSTGVPAARAVLTSTVG